MLEYVRETIQYIKCQDGIHYLLAIMEMEAYLLNLEKLLKKINFSLLVIILVSVLLDYNRETLIFSKKQKRNTQGSIGASFYQ